MSTPKGDRIADEIIARDAARDRSVGRADKPGMAVGDRETGTSKLLIGGAVLLVSAVGLGMGYLLFAGGSQPVQPTQTTPAVAGSTPSSPAVATPATPTASPSAAPVDTPACASAASFVDVLEAAGLANPQGFCEQIETVAIGDEPSDQFTQDGGPPGLDADWNDLLAVAVARIDDVSDLEPALTNIQLQCGTAAGTGVDTLCDPALDLPVSGQAIIAWGHLGDTMPADLLYTVGLNVRYDATTPGRQPTAELPLLISQGAHAQFTSPATLEGTFDPPIYSDFMAGTGRYSNHIQLMGPDWFAFIAFDEGTMFMPWICQFDAVGQGAEHQACDVPGNTVSISLKDWIVVQDAPFDWP